MIHTCRRVCVSIYRTRLPNVITIPSAISVKPDAGSGTTLSICSKLPLAVESVVVILEQTKVEIVIQSITVQIAQRRLLLRCKARKVN